MRAQSPYMWDKSSYFWVAYCGEKEMSEQPHKKISEMPGKSSSEQQRKIKSEAIPQWAQGL